MSESAAGTTADIFVSYARDDAAFAERLRKEIEGAGSSVWMDTASMAGGQRWTKAIESAIEGTRSVVVVVSASSNESVWVRREVLYAQQLGKRVVPVLAAQVTLPLHLVNLNTLNLQEDFEAGVNRLLNSLRAQPTGVTAAVGRKAPPVHAGKALWLFICAAVFLVLAIITAQGEGVAAEVLATGLAIGGVLLGVAWKADDAISLEFKRDLSLWLDGVDPAAVGRCMQRWPEHFATFFDRVFDKKHVSWRCFLRSSIASLLAFLLCTLIYLQVAAVEWTALSVGVSWDTKFMVMGATLAIVNLLPDYASLLETRWVIRQMQRTPSLAGQLYWLLFDFLCTYFIFYWLAGGLMTIVLMVVGEPNWGRLGEAIFSLLEHLGNATLPSLFPADDRLLGFLAIPVWTTYFTTMWVWLYFLAQFLMRLAAPLRKTTGFLKYALPVEQRPLRSVGGVMAVIACAGYCVVMLPMSMLGGRVLADYPEPEMVIIKPGEFKMGCMSGQECNDAELPVHTITFEKPFAIGKYEVTVEEIVRFARATLRPLQPIGWGWGVLPVIHVTWEEATAYAEWLSELTGHRYRLPTEAEWEYAARAGTRTMYWWGDHIRQDGQVWANCDGCGSEWDGEQLAPVGSLESNNFGVFNTSGNVREWVQDCWHNSYAGAPTDGSAWEETGGTGCHRRVIRGGSWDNTPWNLRSAYRNWAVTDTRENDLGFRLAKDLD